MTTCRSCLQPIPTMQDVRRDRRWQWVSIGAVLLIVGIICGSVGYLVRDSVFLKRENSAMSSLLDAYVKRVETDKLVDENKRLRAKVK